jgi:hypothetical protein
MRRVVDRGRRSRCGGRTIDFGGYQPWKHPRLGCLLGALGDKALDFLGFESDVKNVRAKSAHSTVSKGASWRKSYSASDILSGTRVAVVFSANLRTSSTVKT